MLYELLFFRKDKIIYDLDLHTYIFSLQPKLSDKIVIDQEWLYIRF